MDKKYTCYCGLYCENCAVKSKIEPVAKVLHAEMCKAGFEDIIPQIPGGDVFWPFLKGMAEQGACLSCREGSGNPACVVRICAREKGVEMCALCDCYPCDKFTAFSEGYPTLQHDNAIFREEGWDAWTRLQEARIAQEFSYTDDKK